VRKAFGIATPQQWNRVAWLYTGASENKSEENSLVKVKYFDTASGRKAVAG